VDAGRHAALAELGAEEFVEPLIAAADEDAERRPGAAAAVLLAIGTNNPDGLAPALAERRTPALRRLAAAVIAERRLAQFTPQLRAMLSGEDDELVARAARGLGAIGDADAVDELVALLEDDRRPEFCRVVAANALGGIGDPRAAPALTAALERGEWLLRDRAAAALSLVGEPGHEALRRVRSSGRPAARVHAEVALEA
jgi:HEAT repeat protein